MIQKFQTYLLALLRKHKILLCCHFMFPRSDLTGQMSGPTMTGPLCTKILYYDNSIIIRKYASLLPAYGFACAKGAYAYRVFAYFKPLCIMSRIDSRLPGHSPHHQALCIMSRIDSLDTPLIIRLLKSAQIRRQTCTFHSTTWCNGRIDSHQASKIHGFKIRTNTQPISAYCWCTVHYVVKYVDWPAYLCVF
jgi:hypothetical protein